MSQEKAVVVQIIVLCLDLGVHVNGLIFHKFFKICVHFSRIFQTKFVAIFRELIHTNMA